MGDAGPGDSAPPPVPAGVRAPKVGLTIAGAAVFACARPVTGMSVTLSLPRQRPSRALQPGETIICGHFAQEEMDTSARPEMRADGILTQLDQ